MAKGKICARNKTHKVMTEFKRGTLRSGSGDKVTSRSQAIAIALSEARKRCGGGSVKRKRRSKRK